MFRILVLLVGEFPPKPMSFALFLALFIFLSNISFLVAAKVRHPHHVVTSITFVIFQQSSSFLCRSKDLASDLMKAIGCTRFLFVCVGVKGEWVHHYCSVYFKEKEKSI